jgi:hypothetical protein
MWITGPCRALDWAYGNLMDSRDINSHDIDLANPAVGSSRFGGGGNSKWTCEEFVKIHAERTTRNNPYWFDFSWRVSRHTGQGYFPDIRRNLSPGACITGPITRNR